MAYTVLWKYEEEDQVKVLAGHPGAYSPNTEDAITQGILIQESLPTYALTPLSVVEIDKDLEADIYDCEEVYLGPDDEDQLFFDISRMGKWEKHNWWPAF